MKKLILGFVLLFAAVWIGFFVNHDSGYVLISYGNWSLQTSFWIAIIATLIGFLVFYFLLRLFRQGSLLGDRFRKWRKRRHHKHVHHKTLVGTLQLCEGRWRDAEKTLLKAAQDPDIAFINYVSAAHAAQHQQAYERRDKHLRKAHQATTGSDMAAGLTMLEMQLAANEDTAAEITLQKLQTIERLHPRLIFLTHLLFKKTKRWDELSKILPSLKKNKFLSTTAYETLERQTFKQRMLQHPDQLRAFESLPHKYQQDPEFIKMYGANADQRNEKCARIIEKYLAKKWDSTLVRLYRNCTTHSTAKQIQHAEKWLEQHPEDADLLLCLGTLCSREKLWGKAEEYLTHSLALADLPQTHFALGDMFRRMGDKDKALQHFMLSQ